MPRTDGAAEPGQVSTVQHQTSTDAGAWHPETSVPLLLHHPRLRVPGHRGGPGGGPELREGEHQIHGQTVSITT